MENNTLPQFFDYLFSKSINLRFTKNNVFRLVFLKLENTIRIDSRNKLERIKNNLLNFAHYNLLKLSVERTFFSFRNICLFFIVSYLSSSTAFAQVALPEAKRCTSKDLQLVEARLTGGDACNSCTAGDVTRTLTLSINNTTGSNRTSFAFWGTLERYNGTTLVFSGPISGCNSTPLPGNTSALPPNKITDLDFNQITYTCGERLVITNLFLAWTSAADNASCPLESSKIAPKCGTLPFIEINAGVNGTVTAASATCTAGGSITVTPFGGVPPYTVKLGNGTPVNVAAGASTTFSGLAASTYNITITDSALPTHCSIIKPKTVGGATPLGKPAATVVQPTCTIGTGTVNVTSPVTGVTYTLKQSNVVIYTAVSGVFSTVTPGTYDFAATLGECTTPGDAVTVDQPPTLPPAPSLKITQPSLCGSSSTGSIEVCNPVVDYIYKLYLNGVLNTTKSKYVSGPLVFDGLAAGSNPSVTATTAGGCISAPTSCSNATATCSQPFAKTTDTVTPKETAKTSETELAGFEAYPVPFKNQFTIRYNFDYVSDVKIEVFNSQGARVLSKVDTNSYLNKEIALDLKMNSGRQQVYVVKLTTNRGSSTKKVISSQ
ncbi:T9SS type A sorting domain-containing protein [Flavobacterium sp. W1B]|uniref:T9SS type A sorting domain-containing protein n=1 Tax=Flavobacterium sp. W1B TaxID=3394146 RepID=UPI0039BD80B4